MRTPVLVSGVAALALLTACKTVSSAASGVKSAGSAVASGVGSAVGAVPSLVNVNGSSSSPLRNVRIVGTGTIDGQGWLYGIAGAPDVEHARQLGLAESTEATVDTIEQNGVLAKEIYDSCVAAGGPAGNSTCYGKRSNLISGSNVDNMYVGDGLRVTVGTDPENDRFVAALGDLV